MASSTAGEMATVLRSAVSSVPMLPCTQSWDLGAHASGMWDAGRLEGGGVGVLQGGQQPGPEALGRAGSAGGMWDGCWYD